MRPTALLAAAILLVPAASLGSEDVAAQIDAIAPLVNAGELDALGGPGTAAELVEGIDGRWYTLDNTVRNWTADADARDVLARAIERLCADDWENLVTHTATGPDSFRVDQRSPEGEDHGSFELRAVDPEGRVFSIELDEDYLLAIYGLEDAPHGLRQPRQSDRRSGCGAG
jgi:hypothetical protein